MKVKHLHKLLLTVVLSFILLGGAVAQEFVDGKMQGTIRVKMSPIIQASLKSIKSTRKGVSTGIVSFDAVSDQVSASNMKRVFRYSPLFEERHQQSGLHLWYEVQFDPSLDPEEVAKQYSQLKEVTAACVIPQVSLIGGEASVSSVSANTETTFNDPNLSKQWHYDNDGSESWAEAGADINLSKAWEVETGSSDVIVAIIDGGINVNHVDLEDALWTNDLELNGVEGIDDDGNGYVDDIYGYNFVLGQGEITTHYHGTHVAGTVGAVNNNGTGVAGIAGGDGTNPGVRLMSCQIFTEEGGAGGYAEAIVYAADMGAVIGQNSWGWSTDGAYDEAVLEAIDYFNANAGSYSGSPMTGGVSIFAAGNLGYELDIYPAAYEPCIAVASIGPDFKRAPYSVFADWVDVSAPGGNTSLGSEAGVLSTYGDGYGYLQGTSMACPHVSGIAALVVSKFKDSDFTADQLKQHLLSSVHDIEPYLTETTSGKMGNGYIDAYMALQSGDATVVPSAVTDLSIVTAQDFATLTWSVPADLDDQNAVSYNLYWSKVPFTDANLQSAGSKVVNAFFANLGDEITNTIEGLDAQTTYYFAIKAFDRWGNGSELSEVISAATNNGPEIVMGEALSFDINVKTNANVTGNFLFNNIGEGALDWRAHVGLDSLSLTPYSTSSVVYPNFISNPILTGVGSNDLSVDGYIAAPFYESLDERLKYVDYSTDATKAIGENDTTITNSAATWYKVEDEEGFNLTHMWLNLNVKAERGPIVIEIWKGSVLKEATLVSAQNYVPQYSTWASHYVKLEEQIHFDKGDVFWTVVHIPSGQLYPLTLAEETEDDYSDRCFMSFNGGETWTSLASEINQDKYVWAWVMRSTMDKLEDHITITPKDGVLGSGEQQAVKVDIDASNLIDGYYEENVVVISNDPKNKVARGKVNYTVDGHEPIISSAKTVDFGNVFVGKKKTFDVQIVNSGLRGFKLMADGYTSANPEIFIAEGVISGDSIPALSEGTVRVSFAPDSEGIFNSTITLTDGLGITYKFSVNGVGTIPAEIVVEDMETGINEYTIPGDLTVGDAVASRSFTITNDGKYPLHYKVPKFAPDFEVEGLEKPVNNFGYTYDYMLKGDYPSGMTAAEKRAAHNWVDIKNTGTNITEELRGPDYAIEAEIGFSFPFRDRFYNKVWINEQGAVIFGEEGNKNLDWASGSTLNPAYLRDYDMITAEMYAPTYADNSVIAYKREDGLFRVQFYNLRYGNSIGVDFQIVLHANGDVDVLFDKSAYNESSLIAIVDRDNADIALIHNSDYPVAMAEGKSSYNVYNEYFHFYHPGEDMISNVTNPSGTVLPGESVDLEVSFNTENVLQDAVYERLAVVSNDPNLPVTTYTVNANFVDGGIPQLTTDDETIDFGDVMKTDDVELVVNLTNSGSADIQISDIQFAATGLFSTQRNEDLPLTVKARQSVHIPVKINTGSQSDVAVGEVSDVMTVTDENGGTFSISLKGNIIENPIISVNPVDGITHEMNAGETYETQITVNNDGDGELEYAVVPTDWYYLKDNSETETLEFKEFDYTYVKSYENKWVDIYESASHTNLESKFLDDNIAYYTLPLDQEYMYYGEKYDTLYIGLMGWVSFIQPEVESWQERPTMSPQEDNIKGAISPMAAFQVPYYYSVSQKQGIYYQEKGNQVIVTWDSYVPVAGNRAEYSFQVIINKNGTLDFNYRDLDFPNVAAVIGVERPDEQDGLLIWRDYMPSNIEYMSYTVSPVQKMRVQANSSQVVDIVLDATVLNDGVYTSDLHLINNAVGKEDVIIPMELTVNGTPELEVENGTADAVWYVEGKTYTHEFNIINSGTKTVYFGTVQESGSNEISLSYKYPAVYYRGNVIIEEGTIPIDQFVGEVVMQSIGKGEAEIANGTSLAPGEEWNMVLTYTPSTVGTAIKNLQLLDVDGLVVLNSNLTIESKVPPAITLSENEVTKHAQDETYTTSHEIVIGNVEGSGDLEWNIELLFNRGAAVSEASTQASLKSTSVSKAVQLEVAENVDNISNLKSTSENEYNRTVSYTDEDSKNNNIGFGAGLAFITATKFYAPADGFNLSHVETFYIHESVLSGVMNVEIKAGGDNVSNAITIGKGSLSLSFDEADAEVGEYVTVQLDDPIYIYPNEGFYVVITYPLGVSKPQGVVFVEDENIADDRYFFNYSGDWFDMTTQSGFEDMAFMVKAHEEAYDKKTWLSIDGDTYSGTTEVGEQSTIKLNFVASFAQEVKNNAHLIVTSNDPINESMVVDVNLLMNEAPVVTLSSGIQKVEETQTGTLTFSVVDKEGDSFTNEIIADMEWVTVTDNNNEIVVIANPGYSDQGVHTIEIRSKDEHGVEMSYTYDIQVINVNRSPELTTAVADTTVVWEHGDFELVFDKYISDIDNDQMTYSIDIDSEEVFDLLANNGRAVLTPKMIGSSTVTITGRDLYGASVRGEFTINVVHRTAIDENEFKAIEIYPNPATDFINIKWNDGLDAEARIRILNVSGEVILMKDVNSFGSDKCVINVANLAKGFYMLEVVSGNISYSEKIIIQ